MKKRLFNALALLLVFSLLPASSLAFNHYAVDAEAVKAIEKEDPFDVRITRKTVADNISTEPGNPDMLTFEVQNGSSHELSGLVICAVAIDTEGKAAPLKGSASFYYSISMGSEGRKLQVLSWSVSAAPGALFQVLQPCSHSGFSGLRAIVSQYTTSDGQVFVNPLYETWAEAALGNPTHILD